MTPLIHPTAVIHPGAELHPTVQVGAYAVIGEFVKIGPGTTIGPHAIIEGWTEIGARNQIFAGAVIGSEPQDLKYQGAISFVRIGDENLIREYVTINRATYGGEATQIGDRNLFMAYAHVGHNCHIGDQVIVANGVALAGHVTIESQARLSGVLGVHQFVHIGKLSMVGGMTRIDRDVPPFMLVEGNPSRIRSLNLVGLKRAGLTEAELGLLKKAFRTLYRSGYRLEQALDELSLMPESNDLEHLRGFIQESLTPDRRGLIPGKS
ncbi:MAG: acyl-ACP--UDP-N-acetylglucosamine O-acyltransferase [Oscillatoriales cyanobacterium RM1_1_9]|nr:acyl-ACP--UDP-N-acetylglucosamine O-acyltransferase [Oscillatoriales cyanobacterium SM2_3_0]NJO44199.1 acyl-ACP--UDP-N-acetylglucosamine O-acyltransferase [Oscillatoriales cyanobacterium RM2_1_1]NJO71817.1 acyl-ACP--UDP-N-acetylglucosamine O-acyltransferase [Oscillatoriales cyanobacterium RM1_1_9]